MGRVLRVLQFFQRQICGDYQRLSAAVSAVNHVVWEQHESEFIISESAARYFKAQGISKLPASKALQTEIEQLTKEKNALYNEYREKKASVRELQTVKSNLDKILRREPERGKGRENER